MSPDHGFRLPRLLLPRPGVDLRKWAVVACDQYTAEPAYWERVEHEVGDAPSTLRLIFPEAYLGTPDAPARVARIQAAMREYLATGILHQHDGAVYVERTVHGRTRRGLMLELDLEHYDFSAESTSLIRPTEGTMVERLAPRIAVRRGAELELPHVLVLIDDPQHTVIKPIGAARNALRRLYDTDLMEGGGHVAGYAVDAARAARATAALDALAEPAAFERRYGVAPGTPVMLFPMGDGNHSLATAKSLWTSVKASVGMNHPSRWALVEVVNIHDPALDFEPIHRLLFGVRADLHAALREALGDALTVTEVGSAAEMRARVAAVAGGADDRQQAAGLIGPGPRHAVIEIAHAPSPLAVGSLQPVLDRFVAAGGAEAIDYIHGDDVLDRLAQADGAIGLHLPTLGKSELLRRVVAGGPLPRKTFSMGEAHDKRYYVEARRIGSPGQALSAG